MKKTKGFLSVLLSLIMLLSMVPVSGVAAIADGEPTDLSALTGDYEAKDGEVLTGTLEGNKQITVADGATVTLRGADITSLENDGGSANFAGITLLGNAKIILEGANKVKGGYEDHPGIYVPAGKTLTIDGTGSLTASSNGYGAGIGGGYNQASGNIVIDGGTIIANGGTNTAGIGGGYVESCGDITITGGTITATGGVGAAGIGSAYDGSCGNITIAKTITLVTAKAGTGASHAIGAGVDGTCGKVTIMGEENPEIGAEYTVEPVGDIVDLSALTGDYEAKNLEVLTGTLAGNKQITIADGAKVTLKDADITSLNDSAPYAGITLLGNAKLVLKGTNKVKGGYEDYPGIYVPEGKTLTIDGTGSLEASSSYGAGIGGGFNMATGNIVIDGGKITANGGDYGAGIGGGFGGNCGSITIHSGTANATGGSNGPGIGSGYQATCGDILIDGGTVTATGDNGGAGIGSGYQATCGNITISGGTVEAIGLEGSVAIGAGDGSTCKDITIHGGTITATGSNGGAGIGSGNDGAKCGNILIDGGSVTANGGSYAAGIGSGYSGSSCGDITITDTVTWLEVTYVASTDNQTIGKGDSSTCGKVTIMGVEGAITESPYTCGAKLPEAIKDCTYQLAGSEVYSNVPFMDGENYAQLLDGAILGDVDVASVLVADAAGYTYKFYDRNGTEHIPTSSTTTPVDGSAVGLNGVMLYQHEFSFEESLDNGLYIVATVSVLPEVIEDCTYQFEDVAFANKPIGSVWTLTLEALQSGAIGTAWDVSGSNSILLFDLEGYSYTFYDKDGNELPFTAGEKGECSPSDLGGEGDFMMPYQRFILPENFDVETIYVVAKVALPDVIKDCVYHWEGDIEIYANVPFMEGDDYAQLLTGAIMGGGEGSGFTIVLDSVGYTYKFYDRNGTELILTSFTTTPIDGSVAGLTGVELYRHDFSFAEGQEGLKNGLYIVATAPEEQGTIYAGYDAVNAANLEKGDILVELDDAQDFNQYTVTLQGGTYMSETATEPAADDLVITQGNAEMTNGYAWNMNNYTSPEHFVGYAEGKAVKVWKVAAIDHEAKTMTLVGTKKPYVEPTVITDPITYLGADGKEQTTDAPVYQINFSTTEWTDGVYYVEGNTVINDTVKVTGDVTLILANDSGLTVNGEITGETGNLTITAQTEDNDRGAMGVDKGSCGIAVNTLTINGGGIQLAGETCGIEIENGVTVNGGMTTVTTNGMPEEGTELVGVHIKNGDLTVTGGILFGAAEDFGIKLDNGSVTVSGGYAVAQGGQAALRVAKDGADEAAGNITVTGGALTASNAEQAEYGYAIDADGAITVRNGEVTAIGGTAAVKAESVTISPLLKVAVGDTMDEFEYVTDVAANLNRKALLIEGYHVYAESDLTYTENLREGDLLMASLQEMQGIDQYAVTLQRGTAMDSDKQVTTADQTYSTGTASFANGTFDGVYVPAVSEQDADKAAWKVVSVDHNAKTLTLAGIAFDPDAQPAAKPSGYLQTTNADIEESLMWNVFFHIDNFDTLVNPKITVGCAADANIDGTMYGLTYDEERDAYMITVPIRHRLIGQAVSFTLSDDNGSYQLGLGTSGELSDAVTYSFDQYLSIVKTIAGYGDIVDALRAYTATLLEKWPVEG